MNRFGCEFFFVECNNTKAAIAFQKMHLYVLTQLEYDGSRDTDELIDEFMDAYYKCAAKDMRKMFDYVIAYYAKMRNVYERLCDRKYCYGMCQDDANPQHFWGMDAIYDLTLIINDAIKSVDESGLSVDEKNILKNRIELERLSLLYIQLEYFTGKTSEYDEARSINAYTPERISELLAEFKNGCEKFGVTEVDGDGDVRGTLERWKAEADGASREWENRIIEHYRKIDELNSEYDE